MPIKWYREAITDKNITENLKNSYTLISGLLVKSTL
jgi:hypothetical protein